MEKDVNKKCFFTFISGEMAWQLGRRMYYKDDSAGNILYIESNHPFKVKTGVVKNVVNHTLMISDENHLDNEIGIEKQIFRQDDYPARLIKRIIVEQCNLFHNYSTELV